jgi:hypothetical protein
MDVGMQPGINTMNIRREACIQDANLRKTVLISDHQ